MSFTFIFVVGAVLVAGALLLAYGPTVRLVRWGEEVFFDANPRAGFYVYTFLSCLAVGLALVAFWKAQLPQLASLLLFAGATNPWVKEWNPWPILQRAAGYTSGALGFYTVVAAGSILVNCMMENEPVDPTNIWLLLRFALAMQGIIDLIAGALGGYLLGDLDVLTGGPQPVFEPWSFSPGSECPSPEKMIETLEF